MPRRDVPVHYLRQNEGCWSPPSVVFFDTETHSHDRGDDELLTLRSWYALAVDRDHIKGKGPEALWGNGSTRTDFAQWLDRWMVGRTTVWAFAHNLSFDLAVTLLPEHLAKLDWEVGQFAMSDKSVWMRLKRRGKTLTLCDSWTWFPRPLDTVAVGVGLPKLTLPKETDPDFVWQARCARDVEVLSQAMLTLMTWWDRQRLGRFTITGPATGFNALRHRLPEQRIVIDPDPDGRAHDRLALKGGRRDVTRVGSFDHGPFVHVDFTAAYCTIAQHFPLPARRMRPFESLDVDHAYVDSERYGVVAEAHIRTDTPRYPLRLHDVTWYPVGEFKTTLCGPEIAWARENGDLVSIGPGRVHRLYPFMSAWAAWLLDVMAGAIDDVPPVVKITAKHWSRTCVGKWAGRTGRSEVVGPSLWPGWHYEPGRDRRSGCRGSLVAMNGDTYWVWHDQETDNAYPAVTAWVESHVRVRLGRLLDYLGPDVWVQADTDGAILDLSSAVRLVQAGVKLGHKPTDSLGAAAALCDHLGPLTAPLVPRPKAVWDHLDVIGPQHLLTPDGPKLSGIRADAKPGGDGKLYAHQWPGLLWQMGHGDPSGYVRPWAHWTVPSTTAHRWVTEQGDALPVVAHLDENGATQLSKWADTDYPEFGHVPLEDQVAGLRHLK